MKWEFKHQDLRMLILSEIKQIIFTQVGENFNYLS